MAVTHRTLERSIRGLAFGATRDFQKRQQNAARIGMQEGFQQFQIPISGTAYQGITWAKKRLDFSFHFYHSPGRREDADFDRPQFSYGVVVEPDDETGAVTPVIVTACVSWIDGERQQTSGAVVHVGIHSPTPDPQDFSGYLHLTFQGWGAAPDQSTPL